MTADRDVTRFVRAWLEDGATVLPDRVLDIVLDQLPATPQRRHWWQAWRNPFAMNTMRLALVAGVVLLATFVGLGLYFNQPGLIGPQPSQSLTPTIEPTPAPLSLSRVPDGAAVPPGTYVSDGDFLLDITFSVPEGWEKWGEQEHSVGILKNRWTPPDGAALGFLLVDDVDVSADPCRWLSGPAEVGPSLDEFAEALANRPNQEATEPVDVSLAGYRGRYLEVIVPDDVRNCDDGRFQFWQSPDRGSARDDPYGGERDRFWILEVDGVRLVINAAYSAGTPEADLAQLEQMVESVRIRPPEARTPTEQQSPDPSPTPVPKFSAAGRNVPAGTYVTGSPFPLQIEFHVPSGWQSWSVAHDGLGVSKYGAGPPAGSGFGFWIVGNVYPDPCHRVTAGLVDPGPSVDDLAGALQNLESYRTSAPIDVSLGGYSGKYLEITAPADLRLSDCELADPRLWRTAGGGDRSVYGPEEHDRIWILDVEGTRLLVKMAYRPGTPESDVAELEQMVESIRIRPPEAPSSTAAPATASPLSFSAIGGGAGADVPAGTYVTDLSFPVQVQFSIPEGWQRWTIGSDATGVYKHRGEAALGSRLGFWIIDEVPRDPCDPGGGSVDPGPTVDDLADALAQIESWTTTPPADVSVGGASGKYVEIAAPAELPRCLDLRGLATASFLGHTIGPSSQYRIWILEADGTRFVVALSYRPPTPETDVIELQGMVDSIVIRP